MTVARIKQEFVYFNVSGLKQLFVKFFGGFDFEKSENEENYPRHERRSIGRYRKTIVSKISPHLRKGIYVLSN